jgi:hypothetical protein
MKKEIFILFLLLWSNVLFAAQASFRMDVLDKSYITIHGYSNFVSFDLIQRGEDFPKKRYAITARQTERTIVVVPNEISIPVNNFRSDNLMALRDFKKLIKYPRFVSINVQLDNIEVQNNAKGLEKSKGLAVVHITLAGQIRKYTLPLTACQASGKHTFDSLIRINIKDFGLEPPVELMGLIKVSEWIDVEFHIEAAISELTDASDMKQTK